MVSDTVTTILMLLVSLGTHLVFLLLGFKLGRKTQLPPVQGVAKEKELKVQKPYIELVTDDPWNQALTEDQNKREPRVLGGL